MIGYFDAGTGTMIISAVAAGFAGIVMFGKSVWYKLAFWRKPQDSSIDQAVNVDLDDLEGTDGLDIGEIDDAELEIN
ncbi:MAG: hypothetical protein ACR2QE_06295 [Acidimicrobiales bacterium]